MIYGKVWGTTEPLISTPFIDVHRLRVNSGACCSWHKHEYKWNAFFVIEGALLIEVRRQAYDLTDVTTLLSGQMTTVAPGEVHRFVGCSEMSIAVELYYPQPLGEDIIRQGVGAAAMGEF